MTAMRTLVTYEIKKTLDNRAGMAACVIVWILLVAIAVANIMTAGARDGDTGAWDGIFNWMSFYALVILAAAIAVSGVYAGEYQNRTAAVVLPTRNGTCMLPLAKTTAALVFASTYYLLCVGSICGIYLAMLGPDGAGLPCQIFDFASPYPYSVGAVCGLCLLVGYVVCLDATAFTLLLSSKLRCVMPVAVVPLAVILLGILGKLITPPWPRSQTLRL
ncbi:hypothetical protein M1L65_02135 [Slackia exigua]|uniref:hypothetical protein n=1 Tax=Slackia exigua TaxID=84109 RepID=UPI003B9F117B